MSYVSGVARSTFYSAGQWNKRHAQSYASPESAKTRITCGWDLLRVQLLRQWNRLTVKEVDEAGPDRRRLAKLVQRKYGIPSELIEHYLVNFERTLPLA